MSKKLEKHLAKYQGNAWRVMLGSLAADLGVSRDSLERLELGWAPVVQFKRGPNFQGWWAIPERDAAANPVGLSLRGQSGFKCMFPGSNHGLVYEVNPGHERGQSAYMHGAHNWVRLYDAGVDCPVCGKPDGCLVSAEDPNDPKAVVCIRTKEGASKPMKFGYLHIRKGEGRVAGASPLPPSDDPVIVVEGMTDTAAAMDLGFVAVGRPSNKAGLGVLKDLVRGRDVIVVGENDEAGVEGMVAAYQTLKDGAKSVQQVLPPEHLKDLRQWKNRGELTHDGLLKYVEDYGREPEELKVFPDSKPLTLAKAFLDAKFRLNGRYTLRYDRGYWFRWTGVKYERVDEKVAIHGPLYGWADDKYTIRHTSNGEETIEPVTCGLTMVNNILSAMLNPCPIPEKGAPCWLNGAVGPDPSDLIVFENGILWVSRYLEGAPENEYLLPLTPDYFTTFALPFAFDSTAHCRRWRKLCKENLAADADKIAMWQEWCGLNLTPDTKYQKLLLMRGPAGAGKSLMANMLGKLVGEDQWVAPKFADLTSEYGLHTLVGSQVAIMDEAKIPQRGDAMQALETILKITGEGTFDIPRKYLEALRSYKFPTKFTMTCNELPHLPDHSGAMQRRLLILDFPLSFVANPDRNLETRLAKELPGIVLWALEGLARLRRNGGFTVPADMQESLDEWRTATSPMAAFIEEACDEGEDFEVDKTKIYDAWMAWSQEHGVRPLSKSRMFERLKGNSNYVRSTSYQKGGHKQNVFKGIQLKPWAERRLLGRPN